MLKFKGLVLDLYFALKPMQRLNENMAKKWTRTFDFSRSKSMGNHTIRENQQNIIILGLHNLRLTRWYWFKLESGRFTHSAFLGVGWYRVTVTLTMINNPFRTCTFTCQSLKRWFDRTRISYLCCTLFSGNIQSANSVWATIIKVVKQWWTQDLLEGGTKAQW